MNTLETGHAVPPHKATRRTVLSVSQINRRIRICIEEALPRVWVRGEISNLVTPTSGHIYFTLKDRFAQVRCAFFRRWNQSLQWRLEDGMDVVVAADTSLYEVRGEFQLIVQSIEQAGSGALLRAFEALKRKLEAEGLFDRKWKQNLPTYPRRIGLITSPTGAAIRDVLSVLRRRHPFAAVVIYPVPVQGAGADAMIRRMIHVAASRQECEVLLLARGGGSLEDLATFNSEQLARALHACPLPLVTGIGHEIDFTIADFVADRRAPTPSAAAELVSPDQREMLHALAATKGHLQQHARHALLLFRGRLQQLRHRLAVPTRWIWTSQQRSDECRARLQRLVHERLNVAKSRFAACRQAMQGLDPRTRVQMQRQRVLSLTHRLPRAIHHSITAQRRELAQCARALRAVSPLATLERGYAIVHCLKDGRIVRGSDEVQLGETIVNRLARGEIISKVETVREEGETAHNQPQAAVSPGAFLPAQQSADDTA